MVEYSPAYKYLGLWFQERLDLQYTASELAKSASRALGVIICKFKAVGGLAYGVYNTLYENLVQPSLSYGAAVWGTREFSCINAVQNRACRFYPEWGEFTAVVKLCIKLVLTLASFR